MCVNALNGATFISTQNVRLTSVTEQCVNALNGATFISTITVAEGKTSEAMLCQCPEWGDLHFYKIIQLTVKEVCVVCQCPEWGDLHFYRRKEEICSIRRWNCVNALNGATFISTSLMKLLGESIKCVNALSGATSISTLASGNPHK